MEKANNRKMNFFVRAYKAVTNFETYTQFAIEPITKAIKYLAILVLIFSILITTIYIGSFKSKISKGVSYLNENIENISFNNKIFSYNNDEYSIYNDDKNIVPIVIVDTSEAPDVEEYKNKVKLYNYGFILLRDKMEIFISTQSDENQFTTIKYSDYYIENMSKEKILDTINSPIISFYLAIAVFIVEFIQYFIYILLNAVILAIMGQVLSIILRLKMKFNETYKMGIYALTLPTLLELIYIIINSTTGFVIQYFSWMYTTISYIYMCVAIIIIKTDFINMQKELIRIKMQEQSGEKEQEEKEEKEKTKDEDTEKKKEEDPNQDNDLKEQTEG